MCFYTYGLEEEEEEKTFRTQNIGTCWIKSAVLSFQEGKSTRSAIYTDNAVFDLYVCNHNIAFAYTVKPTHDSLIFDIIIMLMNHTQTPARISK